MSHNQEFLLECKCDDILGEVFLDQVSQLRGGDHRAVIVMLMEVQPVDLDHTLVCSDRDIFTEVDLIILQTRDGYYVLNPRTSMEFLPHRILSILV